MKKIIFLFLIILIFSRCGEQVKDTPGDVHSFSSTTENTKPSTEKIDDSETFEIIFTLEKPADCISVEIESVSLQKTFPVQKTPRKTFFIVEKKLSLPGLKLKPDRQFIAIGRNFNNNWETFSPAKICSNINDPISRLDLSEYRIRFTIFEKTEFYYIITISSQSKVIFRETATPSVKKI